MGVIKMNLEFKEFTLQYIHEVVSWHYDGIYSFYDFPSEEGLKTFLKPDSKVKYFACLDEGEMIGFYCYWFEDEDLGIGLGLRPDLTGKGLGKDFVTAGLDFGIKRLNYKGKNVKLMVVSFNERAIKLYKRLGFEETGRKVYNTTFGEKEFVTMRLEHIQK
jgi:ribosomal-protein-alanine N-acetyltransferase